MKLKKLLAAVTAAALAVSTMAFSSLTASAATWGSTGDDSYNLTAVARPADAAADDWNDMDIKDANAETNSSYDIQLDALLPKDKTKTLADIRAVVIDFTGSSGFFGGGIGINRVEDGAPAWGNWTGADVDPDTDTVTLETPQGIPDGQDLKFKIYWMNYSSVVSLKVKLEFDPEEDNPDIDDEPEQDEITYDEWITYDDLPNAFFYYFGETKTADSLTFKLSDLFPDVEEVAANTTELGIVAGGSVDFKGSVDLDLYKEDGKTTEKKTAEVDTTDESSVIVETPYGLADNAYEFTVTMIGEPGADSDKGAAAALSRIAALAVSDDDVEVDESEAEEDYPDYIFVGFVSDAVNSDDTPEVTIDPAEATLKIGEDTTSVTFEALNYADCEYYSDGEWTIESDADLSKIVTAKVENGKYKVSLKNGATLDEAVEATIKFAYTYEITGKLDSDYVDREAEAKLTIEPGKVTAAEDVAAGEGESFDADGNIIICFPGYDWSDGKTIGCDDYSKIEVSVTVNDLGNAGCIKIFINSGDSISNGTTWVSTADITESGTYTIDLSQYAGKAFQVAGYQIWTSDAAGEEFTGDIVINSVNLIAKATVDETVEGGNNGEGNGNGNQTPDDTPSASAGTSSSGKTTPPLSNNTPANTSGSSSSAQAAESVSTAAEGDTVNVSLKGNTQVDKDVLEAIAGKDITVKFTLAIGVTWEVNGKNVSNAKKVNLGVKLNTKKASAEEIATIAPDGQSVVQFSLNHNGDLGFKGILTLPINKKFNGKYANLYYYNKGSFEFIGSSLIKNGKVDFVFSHASDYVIVIDDYPYGEDVSSAAGIFETAESEAPYSTVPGILVTVIAAAASAWVIRKKAF